MKNVHLYYSAQVSDNGRILSDTGRVEAHSFTKQFSQLLYNVRIFGLSRFTPTPVLDITNTSRSVFTHMRNAFRTDAGTGVVTQGIVVGTGTTAESIDDVVLATPIAHGTGSGQLQYGTMTFGAPATDATTTTMRFTRVFTNGSAGVVTVKEIGLYGRDTTASISYLLIRDLTSDQNIGVGQQLTVNYDLVTTI